MILTALIFDHTRLSIKQMRHAAPSKKSEYARIFVWIVRWDGDAEEDENKEQEDKEESL